MKALSLFPSRTRCVRRVLIAFLIALNSFLTGFVRAQAPPPAPPAPSEQNAPPQQLSAEELNGLLAPIALYPDALVALILPASTVPTDLVLAARYVASNGDPAQVANQPWDDSVKSLVRYPDVLKWMDQNLEWTTAVGEAFVGQPADVMNSIQRLRADAVAAGNLTDTPQQRIVQEKTCIRIVPAEPDVIYVPQYDPEVVYERPYSQDFGPPLVFGVGFAVGSWLNYDCDWDRRSVYVGQWRGGWRGDRNWDRGGRGPDSGIINVININSDNARQWRPSEDSQRRQQQRDNRASARVSSASAADVSRQSGGVSAQRLGISSDPRANRIPKPSRIAFTGQGNERSRPHSQNPGGSNASQQLVPAPNPEAATRDARGKNKVSGRPAAAPNIRANDATPPAPGEGPQGGQQNVERNLKKHAQGGKGDSSNAQGGNKNAPAPTVAPALSGEQGASAKRKGSGTAPHDVSKHPQGNNPPNGRANNTHKAPESNAAVSKQSNVKHVDRAPKSSAPSNSQHSNVQTQKHVPRSQPAQAVAKQNKPSPERHDQHGQGAAAAPHKNAPAQPANAPHGKGKGGGGEKKGKEKKDKGDN